MNIEKLDISCYKRFFAFGCSFTDYIWPTWADIIGKEIPIYQNWGKGGAGNQFIANSIVECNLRNGFKENDLIIVMWTSCSREDRYVDNEWLVAATENRERVYGKEWMKKFANQGKGLMIRDFATIYTIQKLLDSLDCDWLNLNSLPLIRFDIDRAEKDLYNNLITLDELEQRWSFQQTSLACNNDSRDIYLADTEVIDLYKEIFLYIKEPIYNLILKNPSRPNFGDKHPSPSEHLNYINKIIPNNISQEKFVDDWELIVRSISIKDKMPLEYKKNYIKRF